VGLVATARTFLFVPATRPDRIEKALATNAEVVIVDLEDAVAPEDKASARATLAETQPSGASCVRINDFTTAYFDDDVEFLADNPWVESVVLSKVTSSDDVRHFRSVLGRDIEILALVESARGIVMADEIASAGVSRLLFGSADYSADLGATPSEELFAYPRSRLVVASVSAGLSPAVDGPTLAIRDAGKLFDEATAAHRLGMGGKLCVHPDQLSVVASIFRASLASEEWARAVLDGVEKNGEGVFVLNGEMVDAPVVARAREILGN
jgi:citrate lyase beta subunit